MSPRRRTALNCRPERWHCQPPRLKTLPFSCPLDAAKGSKCRHSATQSEGQKSPEFAGGNARTGSVQHTAAKSGYRFFFRLLTGGLQVRVLPEEPAPNAHRISHLRIQPFWCFELPQGNSLILRR